MKLPLASHAISSHIERKTQAIESISADAKFPTSSRIGKVVAHIDLTVNTLREHLARLPDAAPQRSLLLEKIDKLHTLRAEKMRYFTANPQGHLPFHSHSPDDVYESNESAELTRNEAGHYSTENNETSISPKGEYAFVIPFEQPQTLLIGQSHHYLAKGKPVSYAGTVWFDDASRLVQWQNQTGHYKTHPEFTHQTSEARDAQGPLLPLGKFRARHIDELRAQTLHRVYWENDRSIPEMANELEADPKELEGTLRLLGVIP